MGLGTGTALKRPWVGQADRDRLSVAGRAAMGDEQCGQRSRPNCARVGAAEPLTGLMQRVGRSPSRCFRSLASGTSLAGCAGGPLTSQVTGPPPRGMDSWRTKKRCRQVAASFRVAVERVVYCRARRRRTIQPRPNRPAAISASVPGSGTVVADISTMLLELSVVVPSQALLSAQGTSTM